MRRALFIACRFGLGLFVLCDASPGRADSHAATSCDRADVQAAVDAASDGDTVVIPACPQGVTWSSGTRFGAPCSMTEWGCAAIQVPETKGLVIQGQGVGQTVIDVSTIGVMFFIETSEATPFRRLTGIELRYIDGTTDQGVIVVRGTAKSWRIDHLKLGSAAQPLQHRAFSIGSNWGCTYGLIDHVEVHNLGGDGSYMSGGCYGGSYGDGSWMTPAHWGEADALFVEDSEFHHYVNAGRGAGLDSWSGARYVFRHNRVWDETLAVHGAGSGGRGRGYRTMEIYENDFYVDATPIDAVVSVRGGTARIHHNRTQVIGTMVWLNQFAKAWVETWETDRGAPYSNCTDGTMDGLCTGDQEAACSTDADCTGIGTCAPTHDPPGSVGGDGDGIGYPCRDHVGRGQDTGATTPQALEPVYSWDNTGDHTLIVNTDGSSTEDIDFFNCSSKADCIQDGMADYSDYPYPHPLQTGAIDAPDAGLSDAASEEDSGSIGPAADSGTDDSGTVVSDAAKDATKDADDRNTDNANDTGSCGCRAQGGSDTTNTLLSLALLLVGRVMRSVSSIR